MCVVVFNAVVYVVAAAAVFGAVRRCVHLCPRVGIVCDQAGRLMYWDAFPVPVPPKKNLTCQKRLVRGTD